MLREARSPSPPPAPLAFLLFLVLQLYEASVLALLPLSLLTQELGFILGADATHPLIQTLVAHTVYTAVSICSPPNMARPTRLRSRFSQTAA